MIYLNWFGSQKVLFIFILSESEVKGLSYFDFTIRRANIQLELDKIYKKMLSKSKKEFYRRKIGHLKRANPRGWYRNLKQLLRVDGKDDRPEVESIKNLSDSEQAEAIADAFAKISNEYQPINRAKIEQPFIRDEEILRISSEEVMQVLRTLKLNKSTPTNDVPAKIFKRFSEQLCVPIAFLINECIEQGSWPRFLKREIVTPVPKVGNPKSIDDLRKISGLLMINKIMEKVICAYLVEDLKKKLDKSQYANQKGQSINHYLVTLVDRILKALDGASKSESTAVLATLLDWSKAFDRQDATLAIKSFQENGVRPCLIPLLISFFEDREMIVKWHNVRSSLRNLPGGSPQGASLGIWSFLSQTNDNPENTDSDNIFKFVDDKTFIEVINIFSIGMASHNVRSRVPSNIQVSNIFIPSEHLKTQDNMVRELMNGQKLNK